MRRQPSTTDLYLLPGEYYVGGHERRVRTVLGSCVSITLWHPRHRIGAISHFLLPAPGRAGPAEPDPRYAEHAVKLMLRDLAALGVAACECEARVFGGASMFPCGMLDRGIGRQNGLAALRLLRTHGIRVAAQNLYGIGHRQVRFDIGSGEVSSHQVAPQKSAPPVPKDNRQAATLAL